MADRQQGCGVLPASEVAGWQSVLAGMSVEVDDAARVDLIGVLERLKSAAAAAQMRLVAAMAQERLAASPGRDARAQVMRSVSGQVGLARRVSPARARSFLELARMLTGDMPGTLAALAAGEISEWQATVVGRETVILADSDRRAVDDALAPLLGPLGDRGVAQQARRLVDRVDPEAVARRVKRAEASRRVTVRPAPGPEGCAMARVTATMPVAQAVAVYAGLRRHADSLRSQGDPRSVGQLMSDELFARLAGTVTPTETPSPGSAAPASGAPASGAAPDGSVPGAAASANVAVEVGLVMTERSLLRGGSEPALLTDDRGGVFGQVPAVVARRLVRDADRVWLSRLYGAPGGGELVAMDSRRRVFSGRLRRLVVWRDQVCRMPWCEAPIRHADHVRGHAAGGATGLGNAAGLCEACNYVKESPGWRADVVQRDGQVVRFTTPTGHQYLSRSPAAPGHHPASLEENLEHTLEDWDDGISAVEGAA